MTRLPAPTEHEEQVALFVWRDLHLWHEPRLALLFAVPNGGARHPAVAAKLKAEGVSRGVPDTFLPVPAGAFHGWWGELKRLDGRRVSAEQKWWHDKLRAQGYYVELGRGWTALADSLARYLERPDLAVDER